MHDIIIDIDRYTLQSTVVKVKTSRFLTRQAQDGNVKLMESIVCCCGTGQGNKAFAGVLALVGVRDLVFKVRTTDLEIIGLDCELRLDINLKPGWHCSRNLSAQGC